MTGEVHQRATEVPRLNTDRPTPARMYDYLLGGKDNYEADRVASEEAIAAAPEVRTIARENRAFLRRAVRMLTESGVDQFIDLGSGLPTQGNVHEVAQRINPTARVVYVDHDPIVLAHGRALLADDETTTVIRADITSPDDVLAHADTLRLLDFAQPVAVLLLSVPHSIPDDEQLRGTLSAVAAALPSGGFLAASQMSGTDSDAAAGHTRAALDVGMPWKTRTVDDVRELLAGIGLEPVEPGLVDVSQWRPDPDQPPLSPVPVPLRPYHGAVARNRRVKEFGGVLRKP